MTDAVIGMHDIPVVEHAIPVSLFNLLLVKGKNILQLLLQPLFHLCIFRGQGPVAESSHIMVKLRGSHINRRLVDQLGKFLQESI